MKENTRRILENIRDTSVTIGEFVGGAILLVFIVVTGIGGLRSCIVSTDQKAIDAEVDKQTAAIKWLPRDTRYGIYTIMSLFSKDNKEETKEGIEEESGEQLVYVGEFEGWEYYVGGDIKKNEDGTYTIAVMPCLKDEEAVNKINAGLPEGIEYGENMNFVTILKIDPIRNKAAALYEALATDTGETLWEITHKEETWQEAEGNEVLGAVMKTAKGIINRKEGK